MLCVKRDRSIGTPTRAKGSTIRITPASDTGDQTAEHVPSVDRTDRRVLRDPQTCAFAELRIHCKEDPTTRAALAGMLRAAPSTRAAQPI
jgi:hypothetical protein